MRATLADTALARQARRFVWLELDFDKPANQEFISRQRVGYTPTLLIVDPATQRPLASHTGGLSLSDLNRFLDQGERAFHGAARTPADTALARADELLASGKYGDAAAASRSALRRGGPTWPERAHAIRTLTWALMLGKEIQAGAETAATEAPTLPRGGDFGAIVLAGMSCATAGGDAPWARQTADVLRPLAGEAIGLSSVIRDHRFQLYQSLIHESQRRGDSVAVKRWGHRWLDEIEAIVPRDDDERSALDIARVDAASELGEPERVLPALAASERAMPDNYSASLRLAQMANEAKQYDESVAACERGLAFVTGPLGRSWLLTTKADALDEKGDPAGAREALVQALDAAREIGNERLRDRNVQKITRALDAFDQRTGR